MVIILSVVVEKELNITLPQFLFRIGLNATLSKYRQRRGKQSHKDITFFHCWFRIYLYIIESTDLVATTSPAILFASASHCSFPIRLDILFKGSRTGLPHLHL